MRPHQALEVLVRPYMLLYIPYKAIKALENLVRPKTALSKACWHGPLFSIVLLDSPAPSPLGPYKALEVLIRPSRAL